MRTLANRRAPRSRRARTWRTQALATDREAWVPQSSSGSEETQPGRAVGTPAFMSPEQAAGDVATVGPATDVYSMGATLYMVLTGQPPFVDG
jgi:serine/threonine protein kinase